MSYDAYGYTNYEIQYLNANNDLTGPGSYAYERVTSPGGIIRTSYAHEGYDGSTYSHNVIDQNYRYRSASSYNSYSGGEIYQSTNRENLTTGNFDHYSGLNYGFNVDYIYGYGPGYGPHGYDAYSYGIYSTEKTTNGGNSYFNFSYSGITGYENGGSTSTYTHRAGESYNGVSVPGSYDHDYVKTYTDPYGYATSYTHIT